MRKGIGLMWHRDAGDAVQKRSDAALIGEDDGRAGGNGFRGGVAEIFVLRRKDKNVGVVVGGPFGVPGERAGEMHA